MTHRELTIITILFLTISFNGMAQKKRIILDASPQAPKSEIIKIERINNQDILRVASSTDTIRIFLSEEVRSTIKELMQSSVGTGKTLKDIEGADVNLLRVSKNMKPGVYFRKKNKSISVLNEELDFIRSTP